MANKLTKSNKKSNRKSNRKSNKKTLKYEIKGMDNTSIDNLYTNFIIIRQQTTNELQNKKNPETKEKYTDLEILEIADERFKKYKIDNLTKKNFEPVGIREGKKIFNTYYTKKYGKELGSKKKMNDKKRSKKNVLKPGSKDSYLYRPVENKKNRGPEAFDMEGIDNGNKKNKK
jgi:hypothetical protein